MSIDQETFQRYCRRNYTDDVIAMLDQDTNGDLDLTVDGGVVFKHAVNHSNPTLLGALLKYYEKHKLQGDHETLEYKVSLLSLRRIIDDLEYFYDIKEKGLEKVLSPYLESEDCADLKDVLLMEEVGAHNSFEHSDGSDHEQGDGDSYHPPQNTGVDSDWSVVLLGRGPVHYDSGHSHYGNS
mgnify:CR=1 FL=1